MTRANKAFGAAIALAGAFALASPAMAWTHHHRAQQASAQRASDEQQETAQLNEQQLSNPGTTAAPDMGSMRDNNRATPAADKNDTNGAADNNGAPLGDPATDSNDANHSSHRVMPTTNGTAPH